MRLSSLCALARRVVYCLLVYGSVLFPVAPSAPGQSASAPPDSLTTLTANDPLVA